MHKIKCIMEVLYNKVHEVHCNSHRWPQGFSYSVPICYCSKRSKIREEAAMTFAHYPCKWLLKSWYFPVYWLFSFVDGVLQCHLVVCCTFILKSAIFLLNVFVPLLDKTCKQTSYITCFIDMSPLGNTLCCDLPLYFVLLIHVCLRAPTVRH